MNVEQFDTRFFSYNISIGDDQGNKTILTANAVENLTIEDTIFFPFITGSITINNPRSALQSNLEKNKAINFAGNNRDLLVIDIMPNVTGDLKSDVNNKKLKEIFNIGLICILNELQDSDESATSNNKMNFRTVQHQLCLENSNDVSSETVVAKQNEKTALRDLNNSERSAKTGELLKEIILKAFDKDEDSIIDTKNFDLGARKIKWHPKGNANAYQSMKYICGLHMSEEKEDPCLFTYDYSIGKFKLIPFSKLFEYQKTKPREYVLEACLIGNGQAGSNDSSNMVGLSLDKCSKIFEYKISPINGNEFTRNITNNVFYTFSPSDRTMFFASKSASIKDVHKDFKKLYVDPLNNVSKGGIESSVTLEDIENFKNLRPKIVANTMPVNYELNARNSIMMDLLFVCGDNIVFRTLGSTHRKSGKFIDIGTESDILDAGVAKNLLGRWFIISVKHIFAGNSYYNIIEAVKTYKTTS